MAGRAPSVLALATRLGLANTTFRRNFPDVCTDLAAAPTATGRTTGADAHTSLKTDNARLRRDKRDLTEQLELALAAIQRLWTTTACAPLCTRHDPSPRFRAGHAEGRRPTPTVAALQGALAEQHYPRALEARTSLGRTPVSCRADDIRLREGVGVLRPPIEPMLARPSDSLPPVGQVRDEIWQQKVDGYRVIAYIRSGSLYLQSRRGADLSGAFPDLVAAAAQVKQDLVLDGELVVFQGGRLDFSALQQRARLTGARAVAAAQATPAHVIFSVKSCVLNESASDSDSPRHHDAPPPRPRLRDQTRAPLTPTAPASRGHGPFSLDPPRDARPLGGVTRSDSCS